MQKEHPQAQFEVWAYDEHRLGLQPIYRRQYSKRGKRPIIATIPRYKWLYLYGFVCPESGQTYWLIMPSVNIQVFNTALVHFARDVGLSKDKHIALIVDGAGWHKSDQVVLPEGLHFIFLPSYSPELQPAEKLWPLTNEGIANRHFKNLDELEQVQSKRCLAVQQHTDLINRTTLFKWWPRLAV